jgi:hypothetical protein
MRRTAAGEKIAADAESCQLLVMSGGRLPVVRDRFSVVGCSSKFSATHATTTKQPAADDGQISFLCGEFI